MSRFESSPQQDFGSEESLGVLLANVGTPDEPTTAAVRRYLKQFLSDPRVVEAPRLLWWFALQGYILRFRPAHSAKAYQKIWSGQGSPLLLHSQEIRKALQSNLAARLPGTVQVEIAMSYGNPSIKAALNNLFDKGVRRIVMLPMFPQYSGPATAATFDAVTTILSKRRWVPGFCFINHYHDAPGYISALADSVRDHWQQKGRGQRLLFSFHSLPRSMPEDGDPYHHQCESTASLVASALELDDDDWFVGFQSRSGRAEWLQPYTDELLQEWGQSGRGNIDVICPGFSADCLETLEEIAIRYAGVYAGAGGGELRYIPALNARDDHISFLGELIAARAEPWREVSENVKDVTA